MATQETTTSNALERNGKRLTVPVIVAGIWERILYRIATMGFDLIIMIGMALLLSASVLAMGGHVRLFQATVLMPIGIMATAIVVTIVRHRADWLLRTTRLLRDWVPFLFIVFIYENLRDVAGQAMSFDIAGVMQAWDAAIFGMQPTIWAQRIHMPWLTDLMSASYALWFFQPLFIMFLLSLWGKRDEFRHMSLCLSLVFLMGFLGYVLLPCSPPRYFIEHLYTDPVRLHGFFLFERLQGTWDNLSAISGGAFPSLHVGSSAVALIYAWRYRRMNGTMRIVWYAFIPLVTSIWFSTVYLRHHWVIDIIAGLCVALAGYWGAGVLVRVWGRLRDRFGLSS